VTITTHIDDIEERVRSYLQEEVRCELSSAESGRIGCLTPLEYPDGDGVVVRIRQYGDVFEVSDQGEAVSRLLAHPSQDLRALEDMADAICRSQGVEYRSRQVSARSRLSEVGEVVWRVSSAAAQIAQAAESFRPKRREHPEREFVGEVERTFLERQLPVEREKRKIEGKSGHKHRATIFVPERQAILEPLGADHWNKVYAVYAKFGDIHATNGFRLLSVFDDREQLPNEEQQRLLTQVSDVVQWSRRENWLKALVD
jgi:hypothetical protein